MVFGAIGRGGFAAAAAAKASCSATSSVVRQQCLAFLTLRHRQGSFRRVVVIALTVGGEEGDVYQALVADVRFHQLLLNFDDDMADTARGQGCACGGLLRSARYRR